MLALPGNLIAVPQYCCQILKNGRIFINAHMHIAIPLILDDVKDFLIFELLTKLNLNLSEKSCWHKNHCCFGFSLQIQHFFIHCFFSKKCSINKTINSTYQQQFSTHPRQGVPTSQNRGQDVGRTYSIFPLLDFSFHFQAKKKTRLQNGEKVADEREEGGRLTSEILDTNDERKGHAWDSPPSHFPFQSVCPSFLPWQECGWRAGEEGGGMTYNLSQHFHYHYFLSCEKSARRRRSQSEKWAEFSRTSSSSSSASDGEESRWKKDPRKEAEIDARGEQFSESHRPASLPFPFFSRIAGVLNGKRRRRRERKSGRAG